MNKSFFALVLALPLLAACWYKKTEKNEVVTPALSKEMMDSTQSSNDDALDLQDEAAEQDDNDEHDEK